jgi:hypothetical protein
MRTPSTHRDSALARYDREGARGEFARRGLSTNRCADTPLGTSPINAFVTPIRSRAYALKNRERTKRMLMFTQLHANRQDDERVYTKHIREQ